VVLTTKAAVGINARDGEDYLIADAPGQIARAVVRLLRDPAERNRVGSNARRFVATHHRWDDVLRKFELIVVGAVEREAPRTPVAVAASWPIPTAVATS
jgi:glycosyltransferase involved in cell wall biosynthesis